MARWARTGRLSIPFGLAGLAQQVLQPTNQPPEVTMKYTKPQIKKHDELKQVTFSSH